MKNTIIKYSISLIIATGMTFMIFGIRDIYHEESQLEVYRILCDGFTVPGVLFILFGCMMLIANGGAFTGIGYLMKNLGKMLIPFGNRKMERYKDYAANRKKAGGFGFLFVVGVVFLVPGIIFLIMFYNA